MGLSLVLLPEGGLAGTVLTAHRALVNRLSWAATLFSRGPFTASHACSKAQAGGLNLQPPFSQGGQCGVTVKRYLRLKSDKQGT